MDTLARLRELVSGRRGPRYQPVGHDGSATSWKDRGLSKTKYAIVAVSTVTVLAVLLLIARHILGVTPEVDTLSTGGSKPGFLHLIVNAPSRSQDFCKIVLSAGVLGYPMATLAGWGEIQYSDDRFAVSAADRLAQVQTYLKDKDDDDLVMVVDGYTTWFQLRPQTLLDRYFDIIRRANERVRSEFGPEKVSEYNLTQDIVFSAQKACSVWSPEDPACYAVPASTLPSYVYGPQTDTSSNAGSLDFSKHRQRFLDAGFVLGNAKAMRKLYEEAANRVSQDTTLVNDQQIFSQIFGEQEVHRELLRRQFKTWRQSLTGWFSTDPRAKMFKQEHLDKAQTQGASIELGIGLDYESSLCFATESSHGDTAWITFEDNQLQSAREAHGISHRDNRVKTIQGDITDTLPPLWTFSEEPVNRSVAWQSVPILTNLWTGISPALIRHNGDERLREEWWDKIWFQQSGRSLYNAHIYAPMGPIAVAGQDAARAWWSPDDWRGGARNMTKVWFRYDDICRGTEDEIFKDGKGPWSLMENH